jgi:hypothetical protein
MTTWYTYATDLNHKGLQYLKASAKESNINLVVLKDNQNWTFDFYPKWVAFEEALKKHEPTDLVGIVDAYDVVFQRPHSEILWDLTWLKDCVIFNAEKGCYPDSHLADQYPVTTDWRYLNAGVAVGTKAGWDKALPLVRGKIAGSMDQRAWTLAHLARPDIVLVDNKCELFQTTAFEAPDDFVYLDEEKVLFNNKLAAVPFILHGNGKTDMSRIHSWFVV